MCRENFRENLSPAKIKENKVVKMTRGKYMLATPCPNGKLKTDFPCTLQCST